jgi:hypothetical protein
MGALPQLLGHVGAEGAGAFEVEARLVEIDRAGLQVGLS